MYSQPPQPTHSSGVVSGIVRPPSNGTMYGTMLGAGSAAGAVHVDYANVLVEYHAAGLGMMLIFNRQRLYCTGRAYLAAKIAVIVAVALIEFHYRLHHTAQSVFKPGWLENV